MRRLLLICLKTRRTKNTTTKLEIMQDATQYETTLDWSTKSNTNYQIAQRNGWLDEIVEHAGLSTRYWDRKQGWVYFYKIKDTPLRKFGIVSEGRLEQRVNMVASQLTTVFQQFGRLMLIMLPKSRL